MTDMGDYSVAIDSKYINNLQNEFSNVKFERIEKVDGMYCTNDINKSFQNDYRIFKETQIKSILSYISAPFVSKTINRKLSYFSQAEVEENIYKTDTAQNLLPKEKFAIQNIGHSTQLIQIPGFNILTDPIFYDMLWLLYPSKTRSHPPIENLPQIDIILISHNHPDHVNKTSLHKLLQHCEKMGWQQPKVFLPIGDKKLFESFGFSHVEEVDWFTKITITKESTQDILHIISIPADHRSGWRGIDHHKSLVTGWVISPENEEVIFKFSGDTRPLSNENQEATDIVLFYEIKRKRYNEEKPDDDVIIPEIICFEPSGPNYTRQDMDVTHQSTSYSILLKFKEAINLAKISEKSIVNFLHKLKTVMMHHNKFELGPDRFNEGLFIFKKLVTYLDLSAEDLNAENARQKEKLDRNIDQEIIRNTIPFVFRLITAILPEKTSLLTHAKDFIITDIKLTIHLMEKLGVENVQEYLKKYTMSNTTFPKVGERLNHEQLRKSICNINKIQKYNKYFEQ